MLLGQQAALWRFCYLRCGVDDRELYLEAHAGEYENGSLELVAYNQKNITKLLGSDPSTLNISKDTQAEGLPNKEDNKPVFDDVQMFDRLVMFLVSHQIRSKSQPLTIQVQSLTPNHEELFKILCSICENSRRKKPINRRV